MFKLKYYITAAAVWLLVQGNYHAQGLSLSEAVDITLKNNKQIKQYNEKLEQKKYQDLEALGNFLPVINLSGSYNHLNGPLEIDLSPIRNAMIQLQAKNQVEYTNIYSLLAGRAQLSDQQRSALLAQYSSQLNSIFPAFTETLKKQDYKSASFTFTQPLFMGGKLLSYKNLTSDEEAAAEAELTQARNDRITGTIHNYLSVVLLNDVIKTRLEVLEGVKQHRDRAKKLLENGLIANYNLLRAEVAVAEAEDNLFNDRNNLELALLALKNTMGLDENSTVLISDSLLYTSFADSSADFNSIAASSSPVLKIISYKKEAVSQKYKIERSAFLPSVAAFGKYELYPEYLSALEPRWIVGVQATFNLFNGLKDYSKLESAAHLENEIAFLEQDTRSKINLLISKNIKDVSNAKERYLQTQKTISLAKENLRLNIKRFETGLGTSLEVIDAELAYERVSIDNKKAIFDYFKSLTSLYNAAGDPAKVISLWNNRSSLK